MSIIDKALGAITPPESDEMRIEATRKAREAAGADDWLSIVLDHHDLIRSAFEACRQAQEPQERLIAMKHLALVLNGHSQAEEVVLYPALARSGEKGQAGQAYAEQITAKMQMADLERIPVQTPEWAEKLDHIRGAVLHHMYEEEDRWFLRLRQDYEDQDSLARRYCEEFERYVGYEATGRRVGQETRSFAAPADRPPSLQ
jgi:hypothetical protein